jgi:hypothetical protein
MNTYWKQLSLIQIAKMRRCVVYIISHNNLSIHASSKYFL